MRAVTDRQRQVYDFIASYQRRHGSAPTLQEIAVHLGITGNLGVLRHLEALEKKGYLSRRSGSSRGIVLAGQEAGGSVRLPIVGTVRAGAPQMAREEIEGYLAVDAGMVRGAGCFWLRVRGDSMSGAQIVEGDLALVRPQPVAANGEIVVALIDGEATLKRFFREAGTIRLQPENPRLAPLIYGPQDGEVVIVGKVIAIHRALE